MIDIQDCIEMFDNDTVSDLSVSGIDLLDCVIQMVDAQPEPEKNKLIDKLLNTLQPGGPDKTTVMVEAQLEKALNMKTQGSKWCCVVVAIRVSKFGRRPKNTHACMHSSYTHNMHVATGQHV